MKRQRLAVELLRKCRHRTARLLVRVVRDQRRTACDGNCGICQACKEISSSSRFAMRWST